MMTGSTTWTYTYNDTGMRTERTNGNATYTYTYNGSQLSQMTYSYQGSSTMHFYYDASGNPMSFTYSGATYYYVLNLQGDVVAILNSSGEQVVGYTYDAWGKLLTTTGSMASTLGLYNPLRYRGYVYDRETSLYYLQSRYYNPTWGRFINADSPAYLGVDGTLTSYNLFAYCKNNPVMGYDPDGHFSWNDLFNVAAVVTVAAVATMAIVASGGTAAPPILAAAGALAGATVTASAATTVAAGVAITGIAVMGTAATANILESSGKQERAYVQAKSNKQANQWAQEVGYSNAEELKADFVGKLGSRFNMYTDRTTGQIILIALKTATEIATELFSR